MIETKAILVEGIIGSGKPSLTESTLQIRRARTNMINHGKLVAFIVTLVLVILPVHSLAQVAASQGTVAKGEITSPALKNLIGSPTTRPYRIYLPPSYHSNLDARYPCIYYLHGYTQNNSMWANVGEVIDRIAKEARTKEMIFVLVDGWNKFGGSQYRSSPVIGDYETYIAKDLVNHIDANYRTIAHRNSRGITGFSMGGHGSLHLALIFPETFGAVVAQGGQYDWNSRWYRRKARRVAFADPKSWEEFAKLEHLQQNVFSFCASLSPNTEKPPFLLDKPFRLVKGKPEMVPEIWKKHIAGDIVRRDLPRYLAQPERLNAIMIVHGVEDDVESVHGFVKTLTDLGIDHVYNEHDGGHNWFSELTLQFMSDNLSD